MAAFACTILVAFNILIYEIIQTRDSKWTVKARWKQLAPHQQRRNNPLMSLFNPGPPRLTEAANRELLDMLLCHGFSNLNVQDKAGLTALHRAAGYGTGIRATSHGTEIFRDRRIGQGVICGLITSKERRRSGELDPS
jgi:hypothetical protein